MCPLKVHLACLRILCYVLGQVTLLLGAACSSASKLDLEDPRLYALVSVPLMGLNLGFIWRRGGFELSLLLKQNRLLSLSQNIINPISVKQRQWDQSRSGVY